MPVIHSLYRDSGQVSIESELCDHCLACARICPTEVLFARDKTGRNPPRLFFWVHSLRALHDGLSYGCRAGVRSRDCAGGFAAAAGSGHEGQCGRAGGADAVRRSIRRFADREVDEELLQRIVEMAATAPMGIPPWDVGCVIVRGRDEVRRLAGEIVRGYEGFLKFFPPWLLAMVRPFVSRAKYEQFAYFVRPLAKEYVQGWREKRDLLFYDAPALLLFHHSPYARRAKRISPALTPCWRRNRSAWAAP